MKETEELINETIKTLSEKHGVAAENVEKLAYVYFTMFYDVEEDVIYYTTTGIKRAYDSFRKYRPIELTELLKDMFGHELAHREKFIAYGIERALEKYRALKLFVHEPNEAIDILPKDERIHFPLYRASAIAYFLFEEYYAEKNNIYRSPLLAKLLALKTVNDLKEHLEDARRTIHSLPTADYSEIEAYFILPLIALPPRALRIFPEHPILLKIKRFCEKEISTPEDVFDTEKMKNLAEIIVYEL